MLSKLKLTEMITVKEIAKMIDHSILQPTHTDADLEKHCAIAKKHDVAAVCVKPYAIKKSIEFLKGSDVKVSCVIGFPHGNSSTVVKVFETEQACIDGATEIDMVINIGKALGGDWDYVEKEIAAVTDTCHKHGAIVKVIFETDYVTKTEDKIKLCQICTKVGADFVKTSTGYGYVKQANGDFNYTGATIADIQLMRENCGPNVQIKCAGGVRTLGDLLKMREAGASRSGATATEVMLEEAARRFSK
jgi:deoxyribose-phosphate aldolase